MATSSGASAPSSLAARLLGALPGVLLLGAVGYAGKFTEQSLAAYGRAIGSSICGVSAIIAAKGAIDADDEDASYAIAAILALGAVSLFVFPLVGRGLGMTDHAYGLWVGLAVDNTAEATAAGALFSDAAGKFAVLATAGVFSKAQTTDIANLSRWAFLFTFAGVGLKTNIRELSHQGWRPLAVGVVGECAIAVLTLAMVVAASRTFLF